MLSHMVEARDAAKHPTMYRTPTKNYVIQNVRGANVDKSYFSQETCDH